MFLEKIKSRDKLFRKFKETNDSILFDRYKKLRNEIQRDIKKAKANYFQNKIEEDNGDPKKLWKHLKNLGYSSKSNSSTSVVLDINGSSCFDAYTIACHFNDFFTSIAASLVSMLPTGLNVFGTQSDCFKDFYRSKGIQPDQFRLSDVDEDFIFKELANLNVSKSTGPDNIPARFLRDGASVLKTPITHIVNLSISTSTVPTDLKQAKVIPLFKKKNKKDVGNYRPVSILNIVSKVLEKSVYVQLEKYLNDNNLFYENQSGFRKNFSTDSCLMHLTDHIKVQMSKGLYTGMVLLDLQKAFDTVNHTILCEKLRAMGVGSVEWFSSYLSDRHQFVNVNNVSSSSLPIKCGVPQGSILGPLLFLCYINDMAISINPACKLLLYADDSTILFSHSDPDYIARVLSEALHSCSSWLVDNKLSLHLGKTECILFGSKRKLGKVNNFRIECNDHVIDAVKSVRYLGLDLDQYLTGESIINNIVKKASGRLKFLYRQGDCLNFRCRKLLCSGLIQCHFDYASPAWFTGISKKALRQLQTTQNKIVRFIKSLPPRSHVGPDELSSIGYLDVENRAKFLRISHVYRILNQTNAPYLSDHFTRVSQFHRYRTRGCMYRLVVPLVKGCASSTFFFKGIQDWNSLSNSIQAIGNINTFKSAIKTHLNCQMQR